jgi:hypothetical protein
MMDKRSKRPLSDRTPGDTATYPGVDLACHLGDDGHRHFTRSRA